MALVSMLTRLSRNLKVIRPQYLKSDTPCIKVNTYRYAVTGHHPRYVYDVFAHRAAAPLATRPLPYFGYAHVKQYSSEIKANDTDGDHRKMWLIEHGVQVLLLPLVPAAFAFPSLILDDFLAVVFVIHHHWGFAHILADYASPRNIGKFMATVMQYLNYLVSFVVLGGLYMFNHYDVGIAAAVYRAWQFGKEEPEEPEIEPDEPDTPPPPPDTK